MKSPRHAAAALTIGPGICKNHLNLASTAERIAKSGRILNGVNEKYEKLRALFESMDNWGFQPGDDRSRDNYAPIRFIWEKIKEKF